MCVKPAHEGWMQISCTWILAPAHEPGQAGEGTVDIRNGMVFTPHATEFKLLTGLDPSKENADHFRPAGGNINI